jgi:LPS sulfotransferase NodH
MVLYRQAFETEQTVPLSYLICATPRSGSTLLCEALMLTGVAGHPNEWMLPDLAPLARDMFGVSSAFDDPHYPEELVAKAATANGVFAAKLMWPTMQQLLDGTLWGASAIEKALLRSTWSDHRYIHISRRDELGQAISLLLALRTDHWQRIAIAPSRESDSAWAAAALRVDAHSVRPRLRLDDSTPRWPLNEVQRELENPPTHDSLMAEIDGYRASIRQQQAAWAHFFHAHGVTPFAVHYEDLVADLAGVIRDVLQFLRLPVQPPDLSMLRLRPLSDARNALLASAYLARHSDRQPAR